MDPGGCGANGGGPRGGKGGCEAGPGGRPCCVIVGSAFGTSRRAALIGRNDLPGFVKKEKSAWAADADGAAEESLNGFSNLMAGVAV